MKYSTETKRYVKAIERHLDNKYGKVEDEWKPMINLIADNLEMYRLCLNEIEQYGIYDPTLGKKNPLLTTVKDLQATIMKQVQHLGLSPYAVNKINVIESNGDADLLKNLLGTDD